MTGVPEGVTETTAECSWALDSTVDDIVELLEADMDNEEADLEDAERVGTCRRA